MESNSSKKKVASGKLDWIIALSVWLLVVCLTPGNIEGKLFPVVEDVAVDMVAVDETATNVFLDFTKLRNECSFRTIEFFIIAEKGDDRQSTKVNATYIGPVETRWEGVHSGVGPWVIRSNIDNLQNMAIKITHRCHIIFDTVKVYSVTDGVVERP